MCLFGRNKKSKDSKVKDSTIKDLVDTTKTGAVTGTITGIVTLVSVKATGFSSAGVIAGSLAAGIQSGIGNVASGTVFAGLTSIGMTGVLPLALGAGAVIGLSAGSAHLWWRLTRKDNKNKKS